MSENEMAKIRCLRLRLFWQWIKDNKKSVYGLAFFAIINYWGLCIVYERLLIESSVINWLFIIIAVGWFFCSPFLRG